MSDADPAPPHALVERGGIPVLAWPVLAEHGVEAVVTTRDGGVSTGPYATLNLGLHVGDDPAAVVENRRRAAGAVGLDLDQLVFCAQTHGRAVVTVAAPDRGRGTTSPAASVPAADALITRERDLGVVVMVADCVPIVLVDPATPQVAVVHAGWRGTVADIVGATVWALSDAGAHRADLVAAIGPAVSPERYEVGDDVVAAVRSRFGRRADAVLTAGEGARHHLDLWEANRTLLVEAGVPEDRILLADEPTGPGTPFFSDRAARPCGRFGVIARLSS